MTSSKLLPDIPVQDEVIWVPLRKVYPNPLNPRKSDNIKAEEMAALIEKIGWKEPLVAYKDGSKYVLLAGHRRRFAAKQAGWSEVPIYVVEKPATEQIELEWLSGLQSGRVDWTQYEWCRYIYERWIAWSKPPVTKFAKDLQTTGSKVKQAIDVFSYFPIPEIEPYLQNNSVSMSSLEALVRWLKEFKNIKEELFEEMGEDLIRRLMLEKVISKKVTRSQLRATYYFRMTPADEIQDFLTDQEAELTERLEILSGVRRKADVKGHLISLAAVKKRIPEIKPDTEEDKKRVADELENLKKLIEAQLNELG